jgi:hypothetical protein
MLEKFEVSADPSNSNLAVKVPEILTETVPILLGIGNITHAVLATPALGQLEALDVMFPLAVGPCA